jgi:hypothetical protein
MDWPPADWDQAKEGARLMQEYRIQPTDVLTSCSTCHR